MRIALATDPGTPGWPNEDFAAAAPGAAVLLDGCTTTPYGADTGCVHGVAWYARTLGTVFLAAITADPPPALRDALAGAIAAVRASPEDRCDLASPRTPAATVTAVRAGPGGLELLALSDSSIVADYGEGRDPVVLTDPHRAASTDPDAARQASTTVVRLADVYRLISWPGLVSVLRGEGPGGLIRRVRAAEASDPDGARWPRSKTRDDATALYWLRPGE